MGHETFEFSPFATASIEPVLRSFVTHLDAEGVYVPDEKSAADARPAVDHGSERLRVGKDWVLFTRPRGSNFLLEDVQRLRQAIAEQPAPGGAAALVTEPPKMPATYLDGAHPAPEERGAVLYFPKPYNDEQVSIIRLLEHSDGVVAQGRPGRGRPTTSRTSSATTWPPAEPCWSPPKANRPWPP